MTYDRNMLLEIQSMVMLVDLLLLGRSVHFGWVVRDLDIQGIETLDVRVQRFACHDRFAQIRLLQGEETIARYMMDLTLEIANEIKKKVSPCTCTIMISMYAIPLFLLFQYIHKQAQQL